jgi:hypothetical protein
MSRLSYLLLLIVAYSSPATAQHPEQNGPRSLNYGFVSPNTRDDLQLSDAIKGMNSTEESELLKHAAALSCVVRSNVRASKAVGSWTDGAENSVLVRVKTDELTIRYLMSRLGREANQKAVLYFHPASKGTAKLIILDPQPRFRKLTTLARTLDAAGIAFRTLVPSRRNTRVYIVDTEGNLSPKLKLAARRLHARVTLQMGNASFIGDGSVRENGQNIFANEMKDYETKHPGLPTACKNQ